MVPLRPLPESLFKRVIQLLRAPLRQRIVKPPVLSQIKSLLHSESERSKRRLQPPGLLYAVAVSPCSAWGRGGVGFTALSNSSREQPRKSHNSGNMLLSGLLMLLRQRETVDGVVLKRVAICALLIPLSRIIESRFTLLPPFLSKIIVRITYYNNRPIALLLHFMQLLHA